MFQTKLKTKTKSADEILSGHEQFDQYVYTPTLEEAMKELEKRRRDPVLKRKVERYFKNIGVPKPLQKEPRLVIFRQVATPNLEISRFLIAADGSGIQPLFWEYHQDKFTPNNEWKHSLGKISFYSGDGKKGGYKINHHTIIDFNKSNGKKISLVKTHWGEKITKFHRSLFKINYQHVHDKLFYDASRWFKTNGGRAKNYYENFLALFIIHGILFENFILSKKDECEFSESIFLPAFSNITKKFGIKPLIVPLSPTNIEAAEFWLCQNLKTKQWFENNMIKSIEPHA